MGFGTDNCRDVDVDANGKMIPEHLEKLIMEDKAKGYQPFFVNCTAGSTVIGAFDPINAIADVCQKYGVWLHIDVKYLHSRFSGCPLKWCMTYVLIIMTSKHFWLLQCI